MSLFTKLLVQICSFDIKHKLKTQFLVNSFGLFAETWSNVYYISNYRHTDLKKADQRIRIRVSKHGTLSLKQFSFFDKANNLGQTVNWRMELHSWWKGYNYILLSRQQSFCFSRFYFNANRSFLLFESSCFSENPVPIHENFLLAKSHVKRKRA